MKPSRGCPAAHKVAALYERLVSYRPLDFVNTYGLLHDGETETVGNFLNLRRGIQRLLAAKEREFHHPALIRLDAPR